MIKKARVKDIGTIYQLIEIGVVDKQLLHRTKADIKKNIQTFFVYEDKGKVVACCNLEIYSKKLAEVRSLYVLPMFREQGVGRELIKACIEAANKKHILEVLAVTDKVKFFKRMGFNKWLGNQLPMILKI